LADKRCECVGSPTDKTNCQQQNAQAEITYSRTAEQEDQCNQLLSVCDCKYLDTPEGKKNCGLAR